MVTFQQLADECFERNFDQRIEIISRAFLGFPYMTNPVGDGESDGLDIRTRYRLDFFDCQTFIETVLSTALIQSQDGFEKIIDFIRYQGRPSFDSRNHFLFKQWIPRNIERRVIENISEVVANGNSYLIRLDTRLNFRVLTEKFVINTCSNVNNRFNFDDIINLVSNSNPEVFGIPFGTLVESASDRSTSRRLNSVLLSTIPNCSLVAFFCENMEHLGIIIKRGKISYIRHAAKSRFAVVEEPFDKYLLYLSLLSSCIAVSFFRFNKSIQHIAL